MIKIVLATCSNINPLSTAIQDFDRTNDDIALTLYSSQTTLECFSNSKRTTSGNANSNHRQTTSISFGGSNAKSRYVCVSDNGGYISVWDMKKRPVKRVRCFKLQSRDDYGNNIVMGCSKACMDRSDTFVIGLHGDLASSISTTATNKNTTTSSKYVTLDLFHLKNGNLVSSLQDDGTHGGSSNCFHFSHLDPNQLVVGTKNGSLLLWDISSTTSQSTSSTTTTSTSSPIITLECKHSNHVTDVAFSPMNKVLAASCSLDGYIMFHDVQSKKIIQTLKPSTSSSSSYSTSGRGRNVSDVDKYNGGLTSLAFDANGYTWAVGTNHGHVLNYDLRQVSAGPLSTLNVGDVGIGSNRSTSTYGDNGDKKYYSVNRLQFAPPTSSSSLPGKGMSSVKKKQPSSFTSKSTKLKQDDIKHQDTPIISTLKEEKVSTSNDKDYVDLGIEFHSPKPSSTTGTEELFQSKNADDSPDNNALANSNVNDISYKVGGTNNLLTGPVLGAGEVSEDNHPVTEKKESYGESNTSIHIVRSPSLTEEAVTIQNSITTDTYVTTTSKSESEEMHGSGAESDVTDSIISSFDKMYERLKNREIYSPSREKQSSILSSVQNDRIESATKTVASTVEKPSTSSKVQRDFDSSDNEDVYILTKVSFPIIFYNNLHIH